jgi:hypothetical protein
LPLRPEPDCKQSDRRGPRTSAKQTAKATAMIADICCDCSDRRPDPERPKKQPQPFMRLSADRLRSTMWRELGTSMVAQLSKDVSVRETVSMVRPR